MTINNAHPLETRLKSALIIDDDPMFRLIIKRQLHQLGIDSFELESGNRAQEVARSMSPDVCLIDMVMEGKEGIETVMQLAATAVRPKLIAISSRAQYAQLAVDLGADAMLVKPILPSQLEQTLIALNVI